MLLHCQLTSSHFVKYVKLKAQQQKAANIGFNYDALTYMYFKNIQYYHLLRFHLPS